MGVKGRALGLALGFAADRLLGDPRRGHPVALFGSTAAAVERRLYADSRARGVAHTTLLVGGAVALGAVAERRLPPVLATAVATWAVLGGRSLEREASAVGAHLDGGDLPAARRRLTHLVGRDPSGLDADEVARAVVESVAENTSDAVVAPLLWGAVAGVPGLLGYRAANTLDAMVGHRSARYERFGWASARLDDLLNLAPARLAGAATVLVAAPGRRAAAWRAWRRDAAAHPSPNAGVVEASFAGALGVRLGGENTYGDRVERRAELGDGRPPAPADIARATTLARRVSIASIVSTTGVASALRCRLRARGSRWESGTVALL
ncbi:cobalamin biosynthesis protein [Nocardioides mangrovi]|uniref:Cobalamin biosynthesis protein CobD n=1 Tax=Nocardioides mangrovi TaxID=2874580 RepID=A0ABS7U6T2_9ACTN|nr:cobalamin biosynthesis protein [Nocardioides mangrovi]MBZ5736550.1 cobalamin biosynthesis protein [Nocardioides mangrovi]